MSKRKKQRNPAKIESSPGSMAVSRPLEGGGAGWRDKPWLPWLLIVFAGVFAHIWCLKSVFYMDDFWKIRDSEQLRNGTWWELDRQGWTYFWWWVQFNVFGQSPVGYHAMNWLLHVGVACLTYGVGCELFRDWKVPGVALAGAVLFVCIPLGSEIPNYARTQDLAWVTLFSLAASLFVARALRGDSWKRGSIYAVLALLMILGALNSKGPGVFHALMMVGVVFLGVFSRKNYAFVRKNWKVIVGVALGILIAIFLTGFFQGLVGWGLQKIGYHGFVWHAVTLCRVFWQFVVLFFYPANLCADHLIAETQAWSDTEAIWAVAGVVLWTLGSLVLFLWKKTRPLGVCFLLGIGAILLRMLYYINEYMPEYRIYPGLPWLCLGFVALWLGAWKRWIPVSPIPLFAMIVLVCCAVSAKRSFVWHRLDDLSANTLRLYPAQARAVWALQRRDGDARNWDRVINRHFRDFEKVDKEFKRLWRASRPTREYSTGHFTLAEVACRGIFAQALAARKDPAAGLREIDMLEKYMLATKIEQLIHHQYFHHSKGMILEMAGDYEAALQHLESSGKQHGWKLDYERVKRKLEEQQRTKEG